jgi:multidrug resistance efflux pump
LIDLSKLKAPGWQRVVAELSAAAPDDKVFLARLASVLGQVSGAKQAALMALGADANAEPRAIFVWPQSAGGVPEIELAADVRGAARAAGESGQVRVFGLDKDEVFYDGSRPRGYVIGVPIGGSGPSGGGESVGPRLVVTLLIEQVSQPALQTTLAMVEVLAGYIHGHGARQQLRRTRAASASLDLAGRLIGAINNAPGFKGAAFQLVNDLARQAKADRVALGWVKGVGDSGVVRVVALSDTEQIDRRLAMVQKIEAAMDECLDQDQPVLYPLPPGMGTEADGEVLLSQAITHAHRELAASDANLRVLSLPLRSGEDVIGVVTLESGAGGTGAIDAGMIEPLQAALDLTAPVLRLWRSDDRPLPARAWASAMRAGRWVVGPRHTAWKLAGIAAIALAMFVTFKKVEYKPEAPMALRPREERRIAAPFEGIIRTLPEGIEPGARVAAGDLLLELDTSELELRANDARGQVMQAEAQRDAALKEGKTDEATQAEARRMQASSGLDLYLKRIAEARITAPIDGTIVAGDLKDRVGSSVKIGDPLMQIAQLSDMVVVAQVDDRDIKLIQDLLDAGRPVVGEIATKAYPAQPFSFTVERVVPLSQAEQGVNAFEVRGRLDRSAGWMRPGMEGQARFNTGRRTLLDIGTRRIIDTVRLWLWW